MAKTQALCLMGCCVTAKVTGHTEAVVGNVAAGKVDGISPETIKAITEMLIAVMQAAAELFANCPAPVAAIVTMAKDRRNFAARAQAGVSFRRTCRDCGLSRSDSARVSREMLDCCPDDPNLEAAVNELANPFVYG